MRHDEAIRGVLRYERMAGHKAVRRQYLKQQYLTGKHAGNGNFFELQWFPFAAGSAIRIDMATDDVEILPHRCCASSSIFIDRAFLKIIHCFSF